MTTTLWHIELSHFSEKVRWALDFKGVPHRRRVPLVGLHQPIAMALTRSSHRRMPVLHLDGRFIGDSSAIIEALERRFPEPPLLPSDPADRARALELEELFDEQLAPAVRAYAWNHVLNEKDGIGDSIAPTRPVVRGLLNASAPLAGRIIRGDYGATPERETETRSAILAVADRVERELGPSGYLVGDRFSVADLAGAALFTPLVTAPGRPHLPDRFPAALAELDEELRARDAGRWVVEMYARHRGAWRPDGMEPVR